MGTKYYKTKEYKALSERIRQAFKEDRGYTTSAQTALKYQQDVKSGKVKFSAEHASGLLRRSGTIYDKRRRTPDAIEARKREQITSLVNELMEVYGTSGEAEMYSGDDMSYDLDKMLTSLRAYRDEQKERWSEL